MRVPVIQAARGLRSKAQQIGKPQVGQVAVKIKAGGVCVSDLHYFNHGDSGISVCINRCFPRTR